jgi:hypothetical protein
MKRASRSMRMHAIFHQAALILEATITNPLQHEPLPHRRSYVPRVKLQRVLSLCIGHPRFDAMHAIHTNCVVSGDEQIIQNKTNLIS